MASKITIALDPGQLQHIAEAAWKAGYGTKSGVKISTYCRDKLLYPSVVEPVSLARQVYQARVSGKTWAEIGKQFGRTTDNVASMCRRYCSAYGIGWPLSVSS